MGENNVTNSSTKTKFLWVVTCEVKIIFGLTCIMWMIEIVPSLIDFFSIEGDLCMWLCVIYVLVMLC
jgi:hypothetical protein